MDGGDNASSAVCRESQTWNEMTHLLEWAERGQDDQADAPCIALKTPTKCSRLATKRVRERPTQHRGEHCPWSGRPDLGGMCRAKWLKKWADVTTRQLLFAWCIPKRGRVVTSPHFSQKKCVNTGDLSSRVNFEDFSHR